MAAIQYRSPKPSNFSKAEIGKLAEEFAKTIDYHAKSNLVSVVDKIGGNVSYVDFWDLEEQSSGSIRIESVGEFFITLPNHTSETRDRFTIAHELGHYFLHYLIPFFGEKNEAPMKAARYGSGRVEYEANWFAASFLMPNAQFRKIYEKYDGDIEAVASYFGVSPSAAEIKASSL